jgi:hypothetical protein
VSVEKSNAQPFAWYYYNTAGAKVIHTERSDRLAADEDAARRWPNVHYIIPLYRNPDPVRAALVEALEEGRRAIGTHHAPHDCYATGPMTGDEFRDLVECPACSFIAKHDAALKLAGVATKGGLEESL